MSLSVRDVKENISIIKPELSIDRNVESVIAQIKMDILETLDRNVILDLLEINFLDSIKIGTIVGTYHFLDFSGKKIYMIVRDVEVKKVIDNLSLNNIEVVCSDSTDVAAGIA